MSLLIKNHSNIHTRVCVCVCGGVCVVTVGARSVQRLLIATSLGKEICYKIYILNTKHTKKYTKIVRKNYVGYAQLV